MHKYYFEHGHNNILKFFPDRIREICNKENAPFPGIEFNPNYFYVTFRQSKEYLKMAQEEKVKETLAVVLTERQARYDLNDLVEKNLIIAEGATTTRKYHLRQTSADFGQRRGRNECGEREGDRDPGEANKAAWHTDATDQTDLHGSVRICVICAIRLISNNNKHHYYPHLLIYKEKI